MPSTAAQLRTPTAPRCPVRGHDHDLTLHKQHVQDGTGDRAFTWACPGDRHRWFQVESRPFTAATPHFTRPRFGWRKDS